MKCGCNLDELVNEVLEEFLSSTFVPRHFPLLEHVGLKALEAGLAGLDFFADAAVPGAVAGFHDFLQATVGSDGGRDLEAAREGGHAADVRVEEIHRFVAFAPHLGVKVHAAGLETTHLEE